MNWKTFDTRERRAILFWNTQKRVNDVPMGALASTNFPASLDLKGCLMV